MTHARYVTPWIFFAVAMLFALYGYGLLATLCIVVLAVLQRPYLALTPALTLDVLYPVPHILHIEFFYTILSVCVLLLSLAVLPRVTYHANIS